MKYVYQAWSVVLGNAPDGSSGDIQSIIKDNLLKTKKKTLINMQQVQCKLIYNAFISIIFIDTVISFYV